MASESKSAVLAAMGANGALAVGKFIGGSLTGSAAMFAEAGHSVADTVNQVFLLVGINLSDTKPDDEHPHGYGKEPFFWSFMAAIFIFVAGAAFSVYEGTRTLLQDEEHHRGNFEVTVAFAVLGAGVLFEVFSTTVAIRGARRSARLKGWPVWKYLREAPDLTLKTVLFEDGAALVGLFLAMGGLALSEVTGNESWDAIASLCIGVVLAVVAFMLGIAARKMLLGAAAHDETIAAIRSAIGHFPEVENVPRLLTMQLGSHSVMVTGELTVKRDMSTGAIEDLVRRLDERMATDIPEVTSTFWELRPTA
jgi:cation diffusion facilitator family transporter